MMTVITSLLAKIMKIKISIIDIIPTYGSIGNRNRFFATPLAIKD